MPQIKVGLFQGLCQCEHDKMVSFCLRDNQLFLFYDETTCIICINDYISQYYPDLIVTKQCKIYDVSYERCVQ